MCQDKFLWRPANLEIKLIPIPQDNHVIQPRVRSEAVQSNCSKLIKIDTT